MGNVESSSASTPGGDQASIQEETARPLRSILRQGSSDSDSHRRSVVFADQPHAEQVASQSVAAHVRFTYHPFPTAADSTETVTHFGADSAMEVDAPTELEVFPTTQHMLLDAQRRRKKRAPPVPPPRRDSFKSPLPPPHQSSVNPIVDDLPAPPVRSSSAASQADDLSDIRKRLRFDLQESRKEYERLKNLRQPLGGRELRSEQVFVDRIYVHLKATSEANENQTVTPASSTETLKGAHAAPKREAPTARMIDMKRFKDLDHEEEASDQWLNNAKQMLEELDLDGNRRRDIPAQFSVQRRFIVSPDPQWSCQSSDSGISNTLPTDLEEPPNSAPPSSHSSAPSIPPPPPPPPPRFSSRSRSEADTIPTFRLPMRPSLSQPGPVFSSSEPLFAFDERSHDGSELSVNSEARRSSRRRGVNDSFRRMRSSIGRMFGSISRMSGNASMSKRRRPVSMHNFDTPADVYYQQHGPLEAWQLSGSVYDLSDTEGVSHRERQRPKSMFDEHLANVWHDVVRTSHEQLRSSNPSLFEDIPPVEARGEVLRMATTTDRFREERTNGRYIKQSRGPYKSGTVR